MVSSHPDAVSALEKHHGLFTSFKNGERHIEFTLRENHCHDWDYQGTTRGATVNPAGENGRKT
jgi:hypothetical protein